MWWFEKTVPSYKGFNMSQLNIDEAWLNISSMFSVPVWLYVLSDNCHECPYQKFSDEPILPNFSYKSIMNVQYGTKFRFRTQGNSTYASVSDDQFKICDLPGSLGEFGVYSIVVEGENSQWSSPHCYLECDLDPVDIYMPIVATLLFWIIMGLICSSVANCKAFTIPVFGSLVGRIMSCFVQRNVSSESAMPDNREPESDTPNPASQAVRKARKRETLARNETGNNEVTPLVNATNEDLPSSSSTSHQEVQRNPMKERLKSLDTFRGLCIVIMIFVDDGGGGYYFFHHCTWDGLYVADLAFPWFIWICGVCIPLSLHSKKSSGSPRFSMFMDILKRSIKLIFLGLMVNTSTRATAAQLENLRFPGVLQRFGICYFVGSSLYLWFSKENSFITAPNNSNQTTGREHASWKVYFSDVTTNVLPWIFVIACATLHTVLIFTLHVPDCPTGYLGPGGLHRNNSISKHCVGGATGYIDRLIFGRHHIHNRPTSKAVYDSGAFDPEGVLGVLTSLLHIWFGAQVGTVLLTYRSSSARVYRFVTWSVLCGTLGLILCGGFQNEGWIPVNKNLWSLSFVLVTSSAALLLFTLLYLVIDVFQIWSGSPLLETGMNSILFYLMHEVCHAMIPWHYSYGRMQTHISRLFESSWGTVLWILLAIYLHRRKLFFVV